MSYKELAARLASKANNTGADKSKYPIYCPPRDKEDIKKQGGGWNKEAGIWEVSTSVEWEKHPLYKYRTKNFATLIDSVNWFEEKDDLIASGCCNVNEEGKWTIKMLIDDDNEDIIKLFYEAGLVCI